MLTTPRLLLRPQEPMDAEVFHQLWSERDPRVPAHRQLDVQGRPSVDDIALKIRESDASSLLHSVVLRESATLIGYAGLVFNGITDAGLPSMSPHHEVLAQFQQRAQSGGCCFTN